MEIVNAPIASVSHLYSGKRIDKTLDIDGDGSSIFCVFTMIGSFVGGFGILSESLLFVGVVDRNLKYCDVGLFVRN